MVRDTGQLHGCAKGPSGKAGAERSAHLPGQRSPLLFLVHFPPGAILEQGLQSPRNASPGSLQFSL